MARSGKAPVIAAVLVGILAIVGVKLYSDRSSNDNTAIGGGPSASASPAARTGCTSVVVAASSEKAALMAKIADSYNRSSRTVSGACFTVTVRSVASGTAESRLASGWNPATDGPAPDAWTPAASTWLSLLTSDATAKDHRTILPAMSPSVTSTPLTLAMPRPMAVALGWPKTPIGWSDLLTLANNKTGWASKGHPEWGRFVLGKTNPNISTSGLEATIGTFVAATGTSSDLTPAALREPKVRAFVSGVEKAVVHYGDTTLTYLANLQRADAAGAALDYVSAVAVEEKSVLDYDAGNPTGDPATLGKHAPPKVPLVAVYPREGTLYSDSPYAILDADWSSPAKKAGAADYLAFLREPAQQKLFTDGNFRTYDRKAGAAVNNSKNVLADGVKITLRPPSAAVLAQVRSTWEQLRKRARVLLVLDVSGSMGDKAGTSDKTKLELAKSAARTALKQLSPSDQVGLWVFTTKLDSPAKTYKELVPVGPLSKDAAALDAAIASLSPKSGTPLYAATRAATAYMNRTQVDNLINAVVVLTDGQNEYPADDDLSGLTSELSRQAKEGGVRVFSIAYGADADLDTLKAISQASQAAAYDARDPLSIDSVFTNVLSNF